MLKKILIVTAFLSTATFGFQGQLQQDHDSQPAKCHNRVNEPKSPPNCKCQKKCENGRVIEDVKCKVYCRPSACECRNPCDS
jgi:hypothetical protein